VEQFSGNPCASTLRFFPPKGFNIEQLVDIRLRLRIEPSTPAQYANPGEKLGNSARPRRQYAFDRVQVHKFAGLLDFTPTVHGCEQ
jgi:hypothetical protein